MASSLTPGARSQPVEGPPRGDDQRRRAHLTPVSLFLVLVAFWVMTQIELVLILGLFGLLLGTILEGPVQRLEARRIPRPAAIFLIYVGIIGGLVLLGFIIVPLVSEQGATFREEIPEQLRELEEDWRTGSNPLLSGPGDDLLRQAITYVENPQGSFTGDTAERAIPVLTSITAGVVATLTLLVITFYYLMEKALIRRVIIGQLRPAHQPRVDRIWQNVEKKVGGWIRGQLLLCVIIGTIATVSYGIIDLPFWPLLGLWAGITEIIPIVGPWIGGIPAVIVALTLGWETALITVGVIVAMQTLENWFLVPRVMRGAVGLTPLTVFLAILAGTQFMGVVGAILAIPIAATLQVIITDWLDTRRVRDESPSISGWRWMLTRATNRDEAAETLPPEPAWDEEPSADSARGLAGPNPTNGSPPSVPDHPRPARDSAEQPARRGWGALRTDQADAKPTGKE